MQYFPMFSHSVVLLQVWANEGEKNKLEINIQLCISQQNQLSYYKTEWSKGWFTLLTG